MSRAAYMREYRAKRKRDDNLDTITELNGPDTRIAVLEAEVARLKRELAARPEAFMPAVRGTATISGPAIDRNPYREFRPVPKPGKGK